MSEHTKKKSTPEGLSSSDELRDEELQKASGGGAGWDGKDLFVADSFSFGVEREMKESGEKGGTADINIGVGELQECTISKSTEQKVSDLKR